jgi:serine/threonine protein kinase
VKVIAAKCKIFASKMKKYLPEPARSAWNEYRVVLCGTEDTRAIPDDEKAFVLRLDEFLKIATEGNYTRIFGSRRSGRPCDQTAAFSAFLRGPEFKPTSFSFNNFQIEGEATFEHPDDLYKEYRSIKRDDPRLQGLLRRWNFSALAGKADTTDERARIALREHTVLAYLQENNEELHARFLQPLTFPTRDDVNVDFCELYRLPLRQTRLSSFVNKHRDSLTTSDRLGLVKVLLSQFAELHELGIAHRDVSDHTVWLERPTKVSVSGLVAAYFPEAGTVGGLQDFIRAGGILLPEDTKELGEGTATDPFRRDVYLLGVASHHLLYLAPPEVVSGIGIHIWKPLDSDPYDHRLESWLAKALDLVPGDRYANAREMLNSLNAVTVLSGSQPVVDLKDFTPYETELLPNVAYPLEQNLKQGRTHVYQSTIGDQTVCVKIWYGLRPDPRHLGETHRLLEFLHRIRLLKNQPCENTPEIHDFGLSPAGVFIVTEWVTGESLKELMKAGRSTRDALGICRLLIRAVEHLHALLLTHGDLSPGHILLHNEIIRFIDLVDFFPNEDIQPHNTAYAPIDVENTTTSERDCYAAAKLCAELLANADPDPTLNCEAALAEIKLCLDRFQNVYRLDRIAAEINRLLSPPALPRPSFTVRQRRTMSGPLPVPSDNGIYHLGLFPDKKNPDNVMLSVTGVRTQLLLSVSKHTRRPGWMKLSEIPHSQFFRQANRAIARFEGQIDVVPGTEFDATALCNAIFAIPSVSEVFAEFSGIRSDMDDLPQETIQEDVPSTRELWRAILEAEEATLPELEISGSPSWDPEVNGRLHVPYSKAGEPIDYDPDDRINVLQEATGDFIKIGELNTRETSPTILVLDRVERRIRQRPGDTLRLQSVQDRASFQKRHAAAVRISDRASVIPNLLDYFDPSMSPMPLEFDSAPTDKDLDEYDVRKGEELVFRLNEQQRSAFQRLWANGPVSLLQGPPGTGKTAFIASFIHYALKTGAQQILLASQSHEAVNNAAEKVLELCHRTTTEIGIVRFGSEGMVSEPLRPYHVNSILLEYRDLFRAEMRSRLASLSSNLGLPQQYVEDWCDIESQLGRLLSDINRIDVRLAGLGDMTKSRREALELRRKKRIGVFERLAEEQFGATIKETPEETISTLHASLAKKHGVSSPDAMVRLRRLGLLSQEWIDRLATLRGNFEEFLAKTRNLVCGTCVGLGRSEFGVVNNKYDWVIIDEAARATPGELSVAMQTGRRVLLVGDHRQLPPLYSKEVVDNLSSKFPSTSRLSLTRSDFERAFESPYGKAVGATLQTQYRMAPAIGALVSECFYPVPLLAGRGEPADFYKDLPVGANATVNWIDTSETPSSSDRPSSNHGYDNAVECRVILSLLRRLSQKDDCLERMSQETSGENRPIGVICTYSNQKLLLQKMLSEQEWVVKIRDLIKVDTVDSYQGKENRIIILSLTRNNDKHEQGFLRSPERINVSISRAMDRLVIVGSSRMWSEANVLSPLGRVLKFIRSREPSADYVTVPADKVLIGGQRNDKSRVR